MTVRVVLKDLNIAAKSNCSRNHRQKSNEVKISKLFEFRASYFMFQYHYSLVSSIYYGRPIRNRAGHYILPCGFFYLLSSFSPRLISAVADWMSITLRHHRTTLSGYIFATKVHIDNRKKLLNRCTSSRCPDNVVNFGPLAAEIGSGVWGTAANFNGFRVLASWQR